MVRVGGGPILSRLGGVRVSADVWAPDASDVFCEQPGRASRLPEPVYATEHFLVVADRFPLTPGHLLVVPRQHLPCFGAMPAAWDRELASLVTVMTRFLSDTYGTPMLWENGIAEQSVHHAHLHLIPMPQQISALPPPKAARAIGGISAIRAWFRRGRLYHYVALGGDHRLIPAGAPDLIDIAALKVRALGIATGADGHSWIRHEDPSAAAQVRLRFQAWRATQPKEKGVQLSA